jgi:hypothetical protein
MGLGRFAMCHQGAPHHTLVTDASPAHSRLALMSMVVETPTKSSQSSPDEGTVP